MNDEKAIAAAIHAGLQSDDVTDLYSGDCRGCGECCSRFLPVSPFDRVRLEVYVRRNGIEPAEPRAEYDLLCPYLTDGRECAVYAARPEICRAYRCDRHKRGELGMFCVECASGRKLPPEGDQAAQDMRRHVRNMVNDGRYGKRGYR